MPSAAFRLGTSSAATGPWTWAAYNTPVDTSMNYYVKVELQSTSGVNSVAIAVNSADEVTIAAGLPAVTVDQATKTGVFRMPNAKGRKCLVRVQVNGGVDANDSTTALYESSLAVSTLTVAGRRVLAVGETDEMGAAYGWVPDVNAALRGVGVAYTAGDTCAIGGTKNLALCTRPNDSEARAYVVTVNVVGLDLANNDCNAYFLAAKVYDAVVNSTVVWEHETDAAWGAVVAVDGLDIVVTVTGDNTNLTVWAASATILPVDGL